MAIRATDRFQAFRVCVLFAPRSSHRTTPRMLPSAVRQLTFVDFLEALTRLAIAIPIPSDDDMREAQVLPAAQSSRHDEVANIPWWRLDG